MMIYKKNGHSVLEYMLLIGFVIGAILVMQKYLTQKVSGRWKDSADTFSYGRQYSYNDTLECMFDDEANVWYNKICYENKCDCLSDRVTCGDGCQAARNTDCIQCKRNCAVQTPGCG